MVLFAGAGRADLDDRLVASLLQRVPAGRGPSMVAGAQVAVRRNITRWALDGGQGRLFEDEIRSCTLAAFRE